MAIELDKNMAIPVLMELLSICKEKAVEDCEIKKTIDLVLFAKNSLTYRYILFSALLAKSVNSSIDILSLQAKDEVPNAYDARSLCSRVVYPFQKQYLGNVINGSNPDPLVNKPGRYPRLSTDNAAQAGDPTAVLQSLCEDLPKVSTSDIAKNCLSYLISRILKIKEKREQEEKEFSETTEHSSILDVKNLLDDLLKQGFGGAALLLVASAMYKVMYPHEQGFEVRLHPVNQSGSSSRQFSDLDVLLNGEPYLGTELKDKPFTRSDVDHAVKTSTKANVKGLLFIAGRLSEFENQTKEYFDSVQTKWMAKNVKMGIMSINALVDFVLVTKSINAPALLKDLLEDAKTIGNTEAQLWLYAQTRKIES